MTALSLSLLAWIKLLAGYPVPAEPPTVHLVPHAVIEQQACGKPCPVLGWFPPGREVFLDDRLDVVNDVRARGILLHELVHYAQGLSQRFDGMDLCAAAVAREREAYSVQNQWLAAQGVVAGHPASLHIAPCVPPEKGLAGQAAPSPQ